LLTIVIYKTAASIKNLDRLAVNSSQYRGKGRDWRRNCDALDQRDALTFFQDILRQTAPIKYITRTGDTVGDYEQVNGKYWPKAF